MHKIAIVLLSIMLTTTPIYAQETASPDNLDRVLQFIREVGAPWSVLILIVVVAGRIIKPMSESFIENSRARTESERASRGVLESAAKALNDNAAALKGVAESMKGIVAIMAGFSTKTDDETRTNTAVQTINSTTKQAFEEARLQLVSAAADLERARQSIENVVTKDHLTSELRPMLAQLKALSEKLLKAETGEISPVVTDPAPPAQVASAERGTVGEVDAKQE